MPLLDDRVRKQVRMALASLSAPVRLVVFSQREGGALECAFCGETRTLVEELGALSDKIAVDVRDFQADEALATTYGVDKIPAIVMLPAGAQPERAAIKFYGIPSGYEFSSLIEDLRMVGGGTPALAESTLAAIAKLTRPVHIQVFVTPT